MECIYKMYKCKRCRKEMILLSEDIRKAKEDKSRLTAKEGSYIIYKVPEVGTGLNIEFFEAVPGAKVQVMASSANITDPASFTELSVEKKSFAFASNEYGFYTATRYSTDKLPEGTKFVKIIFGDNVQLAHVDIAYRSATLVGSAN
jgi:hypothetical protein